MDIPSPESSPQSSPRGKDKEYEGSPLVSRLEASVNGTNEK